MPTKTTKTAKTTKTKPVIEEKVEMNEEPKNAEEFITFKRSHFYSVLVVLAFAVGALSGVSWERYSAAKKAAANSPQQPAAQVPSVAQPTAAPQYVRYDIPTEGYPSHGPEDAPITIVEFSDYQCPFCSRFHDETYDALLAAYPDQIRFVDRNLPLDFHQNAQMAAEAALCAGDQNAYWEMHEVLFANQAVLNNQEGTTLDQAGYNAYAEQLNLDVTSFEECMTSHKFAQFIADDMAFSQGIGVQSTPTFFINGLAIVGAQPLSSFQQLIDKELAGEIPQS
jgi:protein-disulfide isomerase